MKTRVIVASYAVGSSIKDVNSSHQEFKDLTIAKSDFQSRKGSSPFVCKPAQLFLACSVQNVVSFLILISLKRPQSFKLYCGEICTCMEQQQGSSFHKI